MRKLSVFHRNDASIQDSLTAIGLLFIALLLSVALIPTNFQEPGALFWSAMSLSIGLLVVPIARIRLSDTRTALRAENVVLLGLVYWILSDILQVSYPLSSIDVANVELAFSAIVVMAVGVWAGLVMRAWQLPKPFMNAVALQLRVREIFVAILLCFVLGTFYYIYESDFSLDEIANGIMAGRWNAPWSRGRFGDWSAFIEHLTYFGYILPSLTVLLARNSPPPRWANVRVIVSIILSAIFIAFLVQSGARRVVGVVLGGALFTWIGMQPQLKFRNVLAAASAIVIMLYSLQGILYVRSFGLEAAVEGKLSQSEKRSYFHVDDNFLRLTQLISEMPEPYNYVGIKPIIYVLVRPIPRVLWPGKPITAGYDLPAMIRLRGSVNTSLTTSIVGELYASWGLLAVFLGGLFFGKLASMWNGILYRVATPNSKAFYGLGLMVLFAGVRSMQELLLMTYGILGWMVLSICIRNLRRRVTPALPQQK